MKKLIVAIFLSLNVSSVTMAAPLHEGPELSTSQLVSTSVAPNDLYKYMVYTIRIPANSYAIVTQYRRSGNVDVNFQIVQAAFDGTYERAVVAGDLGIDESTGRGPNIIIVEPFAQNRSAYVYAYEVEVGYGSYEYYYETFDIVKAMIEAGVIRPDQNYANQGAGSFSDAMISRGVAIGLDVMRRNNIYVVGADGLVSQIIYQMQTEFPGNSRFTLAMSAFFTKLIDAFYSDALSAVSR